MGSVSYDLELKRLDCHHHLSWRLSQTFTNLGQLILNFTNAAYLMANFITLVSRANHSFKIFMAVEVYELSLL